MVSVLVVDDSAFMRRAITKMLEGEQDIVVCGTARNGEEAIQKAAQLKPDVVTMDVEMPGMGGLEAVREISRVCDIPIIMVSALTREGAQTTFLALDAGAVDFIPKPDAAYVNIRDVARDLVSKVRVFGRRSARPKRPQSRAKVSLPPLPDAPAAPRERRAAFSCLAIGTSTGGPVALSRIVPQLPGDYPKPIVIVQHMPPGFTRPLAERLDASSRVTVREAAEGMVLRPGLALVAPAGRQLRVVRTGSDEVSVQLSGDDGRSLHVPSVDVMTASVADVYGSGTLAAILTGMGQDGVIGLRRVKEAGGFVIGQDEASCVVYGMPRAAAQAGLVDRVLPLDQIAGAIAELTS